MPHPRTPDEDAAVRGGLALLGAVLLASAVLAFDAARAHMVQLSAMCGGAGHPHCAWCYAAAALALMGLAALAAAARPAREKVRAKTRT